jgi:heme exporter protein B
MSRALLAILRRDLGLLLRGGGAGGGVALPILFFLAVAIIVPFAVGQTRRCWRASAAG